MLGSFKAEWRKLWLRPATLVIAGLLLGIILIFGYLVPYFQDTFPASNFKSSTGLTPEQLKTALYPASFVKNLIGDILPIGAVLVVALGALSVGAEYGWSTLKTIYTQGPGRLASLGGRLAAMGVLLACLIVLMYGMAAGAGAAIALVDGKAIAWPSAFTILEAMAGNWLIFACYAALGMALAFVFRQSAVALGAGITYMIVVEGLLTRWLGQFAGSAFTTVEKLFPGVNASALTESFGSALPAAPGARFATAAPLVDATHGTIVLLLFTVAFAAIAAVVVRQRDVV